MSALVNLPQGSLAVNLYEPASYRGTAILVHGYTGSKEDFDYIIAHLKMINENKF